MTDRDAHGHGREAATPGQMPVRGWWQILRRTYAEAGNDNLGLVAAGVAFYCFLALVPLLGALVLTYGLVVEPADVTRHISAIASVIPAEAAKLIDEQLVNVVNSASGKKGLGLAAALALALYGAMKGAGALITALGIVYEQPETRGFVRTTLLQLAMTLGAVLLTVALLAAASASAFLEDLAGQLSSVAAVAIKVGAWAVTAIVATFGIAAVYRYAPARRSPRWTWLTPGSVFACVGFVVATLGFGYYAARFGDYNATYGSLGAVVVLLFWLYLSAYVLLLGAELNSELEHQTARDTTTGGDKPMGTRGAVMADQAAAAD
ncbi:YihY/virulence factor BrkB family protein [Glacieibacterium frigidum]|uniref:YihY/virulence factor BrkB family protein n=1 Tax=Glacieibacterium frigidum TaxID=2593303 RepID=UPI001F432628|nr:YihY/virulence factor BrkB family protein [Glacieibacterium frigidum]